MSATKYGKCEWDGLWQMKHKMKREQWSVDWKKWDETRTMKCGLKKKWDETWTTKLRM